MEANHNRLKIRNYMLKPSRARQIGLQDTFEITIGLPLHPYSVSREFGQMNSKFLEVYTFKGTLRGNKKIEILFWFTCSHRPYDSLYGPSSTPTHFCCILKKSKRRMSDEVPKCRTKKTQKTSNAISNSKLETFVTLKTKRKYKENRIA